MKRNLKQRLIELAILAGVVLLIVAAVVASGIMPVKASSRHWAITDATLEFASTRSVQTNSIGIEVPPLDEPGMLRLGAATYERNCAWCHGSPLQKYPAVPQAMLPTPPLLTTASINWEPNELFYIAKHGIMFTGMPAWPTQARDDDIWPVVAFVREMGSMDAEVYRELLYSRSASTAQDTLASGDPAWMVGCVDCHGRDGRSVAGPRVPDLQRLSREYIATTMRAMRSGERATGVMQPVATRLTEQEIDEAARYFGRLQPLNSQVASSQVTGTDSTESSIESQVIGSLDAVPEGLRIVNEGDKRQKIPACIECHGRDRSSASYPSLIGQSSKYIETQLALYADRSRGGGQAAVMYDIADKLNEEQRRLVALAFQSLESTAQSKGD